ncbi:MAG: DUF6492 family protein [Methylovulum sp.]|nr:DUF6492 family protein [Methylovulum sp.]
MDTPSICLITPTYIRDIEQFALLRKSIIEFAANYHHLVIVQGEDFNAFNHRFGHGNNISIVKTQDILPSYIEKRRHLSVEPKIIRSIKKFFYKKLILGWQAQQLTKIYALAKCGFEAAAFIDSDVFLCDYIPANYFYVNDDLKLFRRKALNAESLDFDISTHEIIGNDLYDITELFDYIFHPSCFKKSTAIALLDMLTDLHGEKWFKRFFSEKRPSEYNLLGYAANFLEKYQGYSVVNCNPEDVHYSIRCAVDCEKLQLNVTRFMEDEIKKPFFLIQSTLRLNNDQITEAFHRVLEHASRKSQ